MFASCWPDSAATWKTLCPSIDRWFRFQLFLVLSDHILLHTWEVQPQTLLSTPQRSEARSPPQGLLAELQILIVLPLPLVYTIFRGSSCFLQLRFLFWFCSWTFPAPFEPIYKFSLLKCLLWFFCYSLDSHKDATTILYFIYITSFYVTSSFPHWVLDMWVGCYSINLTILICAYVFTGNPRVLENSLKITDIKEQVYFCCCFLCLHLELICKEGAFTQ